MRIVDRKTFLALPEGTVFSKYEPCVFESLCIKGETWGNDFLVQYIDSALDVQNCGEFSEKLEASKENGSSVSMDFDCMSRDGCFDDDQLFAVWERSDVEALITRLAQALFLTR